MSKCQMSDTDSCPTCRIAWCVAVIDISFVSMFDLHVTEAHSMTISVSLFVSLASCWLRGYKN